MRDRELYARILGVERPWTVTEVDPAVAQQEVRVQVAVRATARLGCPECGTPCGRHDMRRRRWRHLDTCQPKTILQADVPRVRCPEHGVLEIAVPFADEYVSAVVDLDEGSVIYVADDRKTASLEGFYESLGREACAKKATCGWPGRSTSGCARRTRTATSVGANASPR